MKPKPYGLHRALLSGPVLILFLVTGAASAQPATQLARSPLAELSWVRLGAPLGGLGYDIRMRPDNPQVMYVTDAWAGIHLSTDGGQTWSPSNEGIDQRSGPSGDAIPVFCLSIDPNNPDIVWAGTQDQGGLYRSQDGGRTWEKRTSGIRERFGLTFRGISIEPGNSQVVYAAGEISSHQWAGSSQWGREFDRVKGVLYKTSDAGRSWQAIWRGDNLARYLLIDPNDTRTLYLSTGIFDREAANSGPQLSSPGGEGILKSTDGGQTWAQVNQGLGNLYVGSLFMHPHDSRILLAGAGNNAFLSGGGVYLTTDGAMSWRRVAGEHITSVEFSQSNPLIAYAAGSEKFYRSEDGGNSWLAIIFDARWGPEGVRPGFPIDFQVDPNDPQRIFVNNYGGGNFLSTDGGRSWSSASRGYTGADLTDVDVDPSNPGIVYVNGRSGPFVSFDGGLNWRGINPVARRPIAEGARIAIDPHEPSHVLMSSAHWGWTYESFNQGTNWSVRTDFGGKLESLPFPDTNQKFQGVQALTFAPSHPERVYAGFGVWRCAADAEQRMCETAALMSVLISEDGGQTWEPIRGTPLEGLTVTEMLVHPLDHNLAWAATAGGGVFRTFDGGLNWESASDGLRSRYVMALAGDMANPEWLYAGTADRGVFQSQDGGNTWSPSSEGMDPNEPIGSLVIDPRRPSVIYAGSWASGVYLSEDGGRSWRRLNQGLRTRSVRALAISSDGETLYAATRGEGLYRLSTFDQPAFDPLIPATPTQTKPAATSTRAPAAATTPQIQVTSPRPQATATNPSPAPSSKLACPGAALPVAILALVASVTRPPKKQSG